MLSIKLSPQQQAQLAQLVRHSPSHRVRQRSQALLWSHQGKPRRQIAELMQVKADTITAWFRRWQQQPNPDPLRHAARSGRPTLLSQTQKKISFSK